MAGDQARAHARSVLGEEVFDQAEAEWLAAARQAKEWAVDIARPGGIREDPDAALSLVMVTADEWVAHAQVLAHRPSGVAERARDMLAAVEAAGRALGTFPEQLLVPNRELQPVLASALAQRGITVEYGDSEALWNAMDAALANLDPSPARGRMTVALTWRETEATPQELSDFHAAAAEFYTAAPWAASAEEESFFLDLPLNADQEEIRALLPDAPTRREWAATLMGAGGTSFGVMLHSQPQDLIDLYTSVDPGAAAEQPMGFTLTVDFDHKRAHPDHAARDRGRTLAHRRPRGVPAALREGTPRPPRNRERRTPGHADAACIYRVFARGRSSGGDGRGREAVRSHGG